jgi:hypothetical protein
MLSRAIERLLYRVEPWDASVLIGAVACGRHDVADTPA